MDLKFSEYRAVYKTIKWNSVESHMYQIIYISMTQQSCDLHMGGNTVKITNLQSLQRFLFEQYSYIPYYLVK